MKAAPEFSHLPTTGCAMNADGPANQLGLNGWASAGRAPAASSMDSHYGVRVESDRSWTIYHVFTGEPARIDGRTLTGLSRPDAKDRMIALNQFNLGRRKARSGRTRPSPADAARRP
jgi:hypothetical protein